MTSLTGTGRLARLALRRDRIRTPIWISVLVLASVATAASFTDLYPAEENRQQVAATMDSPAGLVMTGPSRYLDDYNFGSIMGHQMLGFVAVLVALMTVLMVVRHTRTEEESGRAELVRAGVVGRHAHLASALVVATIANVGLGLLLAVAIGAMGAEGITWGGSFLYGAAHTAVGLVFAGVAAVTVQITEHSRGASGMAIAVIGASYVLRAIGDIGEGVLSWFSPIGWAQATYVYVDDRWWPLLPAVVATAALVAGGVELSTRRDVGAGLRPARSGTARASGALVRPVGFAFRLHRGLLIGFGVGMVLLGMSYGSVLADVEEMLAGVDVLEDALAEMGGASFGESFASLIMVIMSIFGSVYVVLASLRPKSEENGGRAEPILSTGVSRSRWLGSHVAVAMVGGAAMSALAGLGFGLLAASSLQDTSLIGRYFAAALAYVPAVWVTAGVAVALYGLVPRATTLAWLVPVYAFVVGYLGQILQFPDWMANLSPFGHVPQVPASDLIWTPLITLTIIAGLLVVAGLTGFRRRDLLSTV